MGRRPTGTCPGAEGCSSRGALPLGPWLTWGLQGLPVGAGRASCLTLLPDLASPLLGVLWDCDVSARGGQLPTSSRRAGGGSGGPSLQGEAPGVGTPDPLGPLVGVGHPLGGDVPSLVAPIRKEQTWGWCRRNSHDSDDPHSAWPTSPSSLLSFLGGTAHVTP